MPNNSHQPGDIVAQKYRIVRLLGEGGVGTTYDAEDLQTHPRIALKVVFLQQIQDWKALELFERETRILQNLDHSAIPKYLDYFHLDLEADRRFYLVRERVAGSSLASSLEEGWQPDEETVRAIAQQILQVLIYLHELMPPVIHRDITPHNILHDPDGKVHLIDFGAVQDTYRNTITRNATFVGTLGYAAPEQFRGQAVFASDLYGLGATLLFLLAGRSPADFPQKRMRIVFRDKISVSEPFCRWLEKMLEPAIENRFPSAREALAGLKEPQMLLPMLAREEFSETRYPKPKDSCLVLHSNDREFLLIRQPPPSWLVSYLRRSAIAVATVAIAFSICFARLKYVNLLHIFLSVSSVYVPVLLMLMVLLCVWTAHLVHISGVVHFSVDRDRFILRWKCLGFKLANICGKTNALTVEVTESNWKTIILWEGARSYRLPLSLTEREVYWIARELKSFLSIVQQDSDDLYS